MASILLASMIAAALAANLAGKGTDEARPEKLADIYDALKDLAQKGDPSGAYSLHLWLTECSAAPVEEASLTAAVKKLREEGLMPIGDGKYFPTSSPAREEDSLRRRFAFCEGITQEARDDADFWRDSAVSSGVIFALSEKARDLFQESPRDALAAYQALWDNDGDSGALAPLAFLYEKGLAGGGKDLVQAYAYKFADFKLRDSVYGESVFHSHRNMLRAAEDALRRHASYLTPEKTLKAEEMGKKLLAENANCCTGMLFGGTP